MHALENITHIPFDDYTRETEAMVLTDIVTDNQKPAWEWLWPGYVPAGGLTLLTGDESIGKTHLALDLAARVSAGLPFPDGSPCSPGRVLLIMLDEDMHATVPFLLQNAGANRENISTLHCMWSDEKEQTDPEGDCLNYFSFSLRDFRVLEKALKKIRPRLLIIDPLFSLLDNTPSMSKRDLGLWLKNLKDLCHLCQTACILTTQRSVPGALCNPTGLERSHLPMRHAHTVLLAASHPSRPDVAFLANVKQRLSQRSPTLLYSIVNPTMHQGCSLVRWHGLSPLTHADLLRPHLSSTRPYSQRRQRILDLLRDAHPEALDAASIAKRLHIEDDPTQIASISKMLQRLEDYGELSRTSLGLYQASIAPLLLPSPEAVASQSTHDAHSTHTESEAASRSAQTQRDAASPTAQTLSASGPEQVRSHLNHQAPPVPALNLTIPSPPSMSTYSHSPGTLSSPSVPPTPLPSAGPAQKKSHPTKTERQTHDKATAAHQKRPKYKRKNAFHSLVQKSAATSAHADAHPPNSDVVHPDHFHPLPASHSFPVDTQKRVVQSVQMHTHSSIHTHYT